MSLAKDRLYARVIHLHGTEREWLTTRIMIPKGELIVYDAEDDTTDLRGTGRTKPIKYPRFKIGDGITEDVNKLPFATDSAIKAFFEAKANDDVALTFDAGRIV